MFLQDKMGEFEVSGVANVPQGQVGMSDRSVHILLPNEVGDAGDRGGNLLGQR